MLLTLLGTCGVRVVWVLLVVPGSREVLPIIASYPLSWLVTGIIFGAYYWHFQKRINSFIQRNNKNWNGNI